MCSVCDPESVVDRSEGPLHYDGQLSALRRAYAEKQAKEAQRMMERYEDDYFRELEDSGRIPIIHLDADDEGEYGHV